MISAVVLTKNEEKQIDECLKTLAWCNEVVVIDDNSIDNTVKIAEKRGARVTRHAVNSDFAQQRNFGLESAKNEWVLFIDADERISKALASEIESRIKNQELRINGYYIKRLDTIWGRQLIHGEAGNVKLLRLAKKNAGKWTGKVHETWNIQGPTVCLQNPLQHYPHPTVDEFLREINLYTTTRANELYEKGIREPWWKIIVYPKAKFIQNYFVRAGFLDGIPGLLSALFMSFHSFLVRGKLWLLWNK